MERITVKPLAMIVVLACIGVGVAMVQPPVAHAAGNARLRIIHADPGAPRVDVYVNDSPAFRGAAYKDVTQYASLPPATYTIRIVSASASIEGSTAVATASVTLSPDTDYTAIAYGRSSGDSQATVALLKDDNSTPQAGEARVRAIHSVPGLSTADISLNNSIRLAGVDLGKASTYIGVKAWPYDLTVQVNGKTIVSAPKVNFEAGKVYTLLVTGSAGGDVTAAVLVDAAYSVMPASMPSTGTGGVATDLPAAPIGFYALAALFTVVTGAAGLRYRVKQSR